MNLQSKTDEELNVMLAECLGWRHVKRRATIAPDFPTGFSPTASGLIHMVPHYCSSLDEVARVEAGLTDEQHRDFRHHLMVIVIRETKGDQDRAFVSAKPRQRTIALNSTLTKTP